MIPDHNHTSTEDIREVKQTFCPHQVSIKWPRLKSLSGTQLVGKSFISSFSLFSPFYYSSFFQMIAAWLPKTLLFLIHTFLLLFLPFLSPSSSSSSFLLPPSWFFFLNSSSSSAIHSSRLSVISTIFRVVWNKKDFIKYVSQRMDIFVRITTNT